MRGQFPVSILGLGAWLLLSCAPVPRLTLPTADAALATTTLRPLSARSLCRRAAVSARYQIGGSLPDGRPCPVTIPAACPRPEQLAPLEVELELVGAYPARFGGLSPNAAGEAVLGNVEIGSSAGELECDPGPPRITACVVTDAPATGCHGLLRFDLGTLDLALVEGAAIEVVGTGAVSALELAAWSGADPIGRVRLGPDPFVHALLGFPPEALDDLRGLGVGAVPELRLTLEGEALGAPALVAEDPIGAFFDDPGFAGRTRLLLWQRAPEPDLP